MNQIDLLGHRINQNGAVPLPVKVNAIRRFPRLHSVKGLQQFAEMVNFYHRFVPSAAKFMQPLHEALTGKSNKKEVT